MNRYLFYVLGLFIVVPIGALIAEYVIIWIAGFKPRYTKVLISTIVAYAIASVIGIAFCEFGLFHDVFRGFQLLAGWVTLTCTHINMVRSEAGNILSPAKEMVVALCQMISAFVALILIFFLVLIVKRVFL